MSPEPTPTPAPTPAPVEPDASHPIVVPAARITLGLTAGTWRDGAYQLTPNEPYSVDAAGPGLTEGSWVRVRHNNALWDYRQPFVFRQVGWDHVQVETGPEDAPEVTRVLVLVGGAIQMIVSETRTVASSIGGSVSDNVIGVAEVGDGTGDWHYFFSGNPWVGEVIRFRGKPGGRGPADPFSSGESLSTRLRGAPPGLNFGGPVCRDPDSGLLLMSTLHQGPPFGRQGICYSRDDGETWDFGGFMAVFPIPPADWATAYEVYGPNYLAGTTNLLYVRDMDGDGRHYYCGFPSIIGPGKQYVPTGLVRAEAGALNAALLAGQDSSHLWRKWKDGEFSQPYDGDGDPICPYGGYGGTQVVWWQERGVWLAVYQSLENWRDVCISWSTRMKGPYSPPQLLTRLAESEDGWWGGPAVIAVNGVVGTPGHPAFDVWITWWSDVTGEIQNRGVTVWLGDLPAAALALSAPAGNPNAARARRLRATTTLD